MARLLNPSNDSCLFCSDPADSIKTGFVNDRGDPIILDDEDVKAKALKALCSHLMPQNLEDIPVQFSEDMFPFCTSCKDLVTELWECQEVIRKTQLRLTELTTIIEKNVVEGVILYGQIPSSAATSEKRFIKLRDVILKHYRESLIIKKKGKLKSFSLGFQTSSPISVISEVSTAEVSCSVIISSPSPTKCDADVNDATGNENDEPALPGVGVSNSVNDANQNISQSVFDNDSLFEEEHHVTKSESQSESEMEDLNEDKASERGREAKDQVVASASAPGPSKPLRKTRKRMSNTGRSTESSMLAQGKRPYQKHGTGKGGMFEGTKYKMLKNKRIKCGCCNYVYARFTEFKRHVRKGSHQCSLCKMIFTQAGALKRHHHKFHGAGVNEKFPCPHCGYQYNQLQNLNTHLRKGCSRRI